MKKLVKYNIVSSGKPVLEKHVTAGKKAKFSYKNYHIRVWSVIWVWA